MASKTFLLLGLFLAFGLLITSEVAARELEETTPEKKPEATIDGHGGGGGCHRWCGHRCCSHSGEAAEGTTEEEISVAGNQGGGGYHGGGGGGYHGGGGGGYHGGGGGGYHGGGGCRHGWCGGHCCNYAGEAVEADTDAVQENSVGETDSKYGGGGYHGGGGYQGGGGGYHGGGGYQGGGGGYHGGGGYQGGGGGYQGGGGGYHGGGGCRHGWCGKYCCNYAGEAETVQTQN